MNPALIAGISGLAAMGASCIKHVSTIKRATNAPATDRARILAEYTSTLSPQAAIGFRCALLFLTNREKDDTRKNIMRGLLHDASAGANVDGAPIGSALAPPTTALAPTSDFDRDLQLVGGWLDELNPEQRNKALVKHLLTLDEPGYARFVANVRKCRRNCEDHIEQHKANERKYGRPFIEDQIAYGIARARTGGRDPRWLAKLKEFESSKRKWDWAVEASERAWQAIRQSKSQAGNQRQAQALSTVQR